MLIDPVVERLHKQREEYMERFQHDFEAIIRDIKSREATNPKLEPPAAPSPKTKVGLGSGADDFEEGGADGIQAAWDSAQNHGATS